MEIDDDHVPVLDLSMKKPRTYSTDSSEQGFSLCLSDVTSREKDTSKTYKKKLLNRYRK